MTALHALRYHQRWTLLILFFTALLSSLRIPQGATAKEEDLYKILGVKRTATTKEIKSAYRRKALDTHPDKRKDIPPEQAAEEFHKVVHAFEILSDENSRRTYDRTGRASQQNAGGGGGRNQQWGGASFHFNWNRGGGGRRRSFKLKDKFKVQEAMSRVMHIVSLSQLETVMLDENDLLERNLLMAFVTPQEVEQWCDDEMVFPYPFAAMSEQGLWWEDKVQTVKVRFNKQNALTRHFNIPSGDEMRQRKMPIFVFGRRGQPMTEAANFARLETRSRDQFEKWVWKQLEVTIEFVNEHPHPVEILWMHGSRGHNKLTLQPGDKEIHTTMLNHEWWVRDARVDTRKDSPGRYRLSRSSMVAVWKITSDEQFQRLVIHEKKCLDLSGHCPFWHGQGECRKNPDFMKEICPLTCKHCSEHEDVFKAHDEL